MLGRAQTGQILSCLENNPTARLGKRLKHANSEQITNGEVSCRRFSQRSDGSARVTKMAPRTPQTASRRARVLFPFLVLEIRLRKSLKHCSKLKNIKQTYSFSSSLAVP